MSDLKICSCENCYNKVVAKGMCETHYRRVKKHGNPNTARSADWGKREKHPLYDSWCWMRKMRGRTSIEPSWDDFWKFVEAIGDRPSPQHRLSKYDKEKGFTLGNVFWKETIADSTNRNEYAKQWRKANPDKAKNADLKKMYGITIEDFHALRESQKCSCKICGTHENMESQSLVVDHCHTTGKVRGLLCSNCNRALGLFKESTTVINNAINYLQEN